MINRERLLAFADQFPERATNREQVQLGIVKSLEEHGIEFAYPTQKVLLHRD